MTRTRWQTHIVVQPPSRKRNARGRARDADVLDSLAELGTASVPDLVEHTGRTEGQVREALVSLASQCLARPVGLDPRGSPFARPRLWRTL